MLTLLCRLTLLLTLALVPALLPAQAGATDRGVGADLAGPARVIDGDTIEISGQRIRLFGIDTVEARQPCRTEQGIDWPCGAYVTEYLAETLAGNTVECDRRDTDRYGRMVAVCRVNGADIGAKLVDAGLATAYRKYSMAYVPLEMTARARDAGFWAGAMASPEAYRRRDAVVTLARQSSETPPSQGCAIKGNISKGGKIYHVPGGRSYARTKIDSRRGERWFCSVQEAQRAGWRAPRR